MDTNKCEVSVVLPCLNEEKTIEECIRRAKKALAEADILGEVVVADNGSTDRSTKIAQVEGARVSIAKTAGYGNALFAGFAEAQGKFIIFLDADLSYEFSHIPRFVEELRNGAELVMGSRFKGTIDHGAMPFLHRYFGTPF
jgi:glycosyltransferase involved in cell wall biosynthesis